MSYTLYLEKLQKLIKLEDKITIISIENVEFYRSIYYDFYNELVFSENNKIISNDKIAMIENCLCLDLNSKKNLSSLYKTLESYCDMENLNQLKNIESNIVGLIEKIAINLDVGLDYDDNLNFSKIFNLMKIKFPETESSNYIDIILNYIRLSCEIYGTKIFIFFGLTKNLTDEECRLLKKELNQYDIKLLDILISNTGYSKYNYVIDKDYCII